MNPQPKNRRSVRPTGTIRYALPGVQWGPAPQQRSVLYDVANESAREGIEAFMNGVPFEACPYPSGCVNHKAWCEAWEMMEAKVEKIGPMVIR